MVVVVVVVKEEGVGPNQTEMLTLVACCRWYARIMRQLVEYPVPEGREGEEAFASFLSSLLMDHTCVPQALSRGVLELRERLVRRCGNGGSASHLVRQCGKGEKTE